MATPGKFPKRLAIGTSQFDQLRALLAAVYGSNRFYTAKYDAAEVSYKPRHLGEFTGYYPFTTKEELVADRYPRHCISSRKTGRHMARCGHPSCRV